MAEIIFKSRNQVLVECQPQKRMTPFRLGHQENKYFYLQFPYTYFHIYSLYPWLFDAARVFFSDKPLQSGSDTIYKIPTLGNIDFNNFCCLRYEYGTPHDTLQDLIDAVIGAFWSKSFTQTFGTFDTKKLKDWEKHTKIGEPFKVLRPTGLIGGNPEYFYGEIKENEIFRGKNGD